MNLMKETGFTTFTNCKKYFTCVAYVDGDASIKRYLKDLFATI